MCGMCRCVNAVGFKVPDEIWARVVHPHYQQDILCLRCFTARADEKLITWDLNIVFYPISLATHLNVDRGVDE